MEGGKSHGPWGKGPPWLEQDLAASHGPSHGPSHGTAECGHHGQARALAALGPAGVNARSPTSSRTVEARRAPPPPHPPTP